jgi:hypothetical protein
VDGKLRVERTRKQAAPEFSGVQKKHPLKSLARIGCRLSGIQFCLAAGVWSGVREEFHAHFI